MCKLHNLLCKWWAPVLLRLLIGLNINDGIDPLSVFPLFLKMVADIIATKQSIIFRGLTRRG